MARQGYARSRLDSGGGWSGATGAADAGVCGGCGELLRATGECCFEVEAIGARLAEAAGGRCETRRGGALRGLAAAAAGEGVPGGGGHGGRRRGWGLCGGAGD